LFQKAFLFLEVTFILTVTPPPDHFKLNILVTVVDRDAV